MIEQNDIVEMVLSATQETVFWGKMSELPEDRKAFANAHAVELKDFSGTPIIGGVKYFRLEVER